MQVIFFKQRNRSFLASINSDRLPFNRQANDTYNEIGGIFFDLEGQKAIDFVYDEIWIQAVKHRIEDRCGRLADHKKAAYIDFFRFLRQGKAVKEPYAGAESDAKELYQIVASKPKIEDFETPNQLRERILLDGFKQHLMKPQPTMI